MKRKKIRTAIACAVMAVVMPLIWGSSPALKDSDGDFCSGNRNR